MGVDPVSPTPVSTDTGPIATEGIHNVSFAMLPPKPGEGTHFKLLEIHSSC